MLPTASGTLGRLLAGPSSVRPVGAGLWTAVFSSDGFKVVRRDLSSGGDPNDPLSGGDRTNQPTAKGLLSGQPTAKGLLSGQPTTQSPAKATSPTAPAKTAPSIDNPRVCGIRGLGGDIGGERIGFAQQVLKESVRLQQAKAAEGLKSHEEVVIQEEGQALNQQEDSSKVRLVVEINGSKARIVDFAVDSQDLEKIKSAMHQESRAVRQNVVSGEICNVCLDREGLLELLQVGLEKVAFSKNGGGTGSDKESGSNIFEWLWRWLKAASGKTTDEAVLLWIWGFILSCADWDLIVTLAVAAVEGGHSALSWDFLAQLYDVCMEQKFKDSRAMVEEARKRMLAKVASEEAAAALEVAFAAMLGAFAAVSKLCWATEDIPAAKKVAAAAIDEAQKAVDAVEAASVASESKVMVEVAAFHLILTDLKTCLDGLEMLAAERKSSLGKLKPSIAAERLALLEKFKTSLDAAVLLGAERVAASAQK